MKNEVRPTLCKVDDDYYLVMADGKVTLEEAMEQNKACKLEEGEAMALSIGLMKTCYDMAGHSPC